ncbi:diphosphate--fructose-6-phosphate 1-phosphotransferase, partial [Aduncisulcus paluster]
MDSVYQNIRRKYDIPVPPALSGLDFSFTKGGATVSRRDCADVASAFPKTYGQPVIKVSKSDKSLESKPFRIGCCLSGGPAAGGHNVIIGLYDKLKQIHKESSLIGFTGGPAGILNKEYVEVDDALAYKFRNMGGFDMLGSGRTKLETEEHFET